MVLSQEELIAALQHEVQILVHLAGKVDPAQLDYRPTPKQRSTLELLRYMAIMGPTQIAIMKADGFNRSALMAVWNAAEARANVMTFEQAVDAIRQQADGYARELGGWSAADFRTEVDMFGRRFSRGSLLVNLVVSGHAAYRTQLFLYLKACGRDELSTMNLWAGADGPS